MYDISEINRGLNPIVPDPSPSMFWSDAKLEMNNSIINQTSWNSIVLTSGSHIRLFLNDTMIGMFSANSSLNTSLFEGENNLTFVTYYDLYRNINKESFFFIVDTILPDIRLFNLTNNSVHKPGTHIFFNFSDLSLTSYLTLPEQETAHQLSIIVKDYAGNQNKTNFIFITNNTPPTLSIEGIHNLQTVKDTVLVKFHPQDKNGIKKITVLVKDYKKYFFEETYLWNWDTTEVPDGTYFIDVSVLDFAGNKHIEHITILVLNNRDPVNQVVKYFGDNIIQYIIGLGVGVILLLLRSVRNKNKYHFLDNHFVTDIYPIIKRKLLAEKTLSRMATLSTKKKQKFKPTKFDNYYQKIVNSCNKEIYDRLNPLYINFSLREKLFNVAPKPKNLKKYLNKRLKGLKKQLIIIKTEEKDKSLTKIRFKRAIEDPPFKSKNSGNRKELSFLDFNN